MRCEYPEMLLDLCSSIEHGLKAHQIDESVAESVAMDITEQIRTEWGGSNVYIPRGTQYETVLMHEKIKRDFNGKNHKELSRRYKKSLQWIYSIVKEK